MKKIAVSIMLAMASAGLSVPALADDRPPTLEEREVITAFLREQGFVSWGKIEFDDDGYWEVDDAIMSDGSRYDLKLAPGTLEIIERELED